MKILTKELRDKVLAYLSEVEYDYQKGDVDEAKNILKENLNKRLGRYDRDIITRLIQDDGTELIEELDTITDEEAGNAFDECNDDKNKT